MNDMFLNMLSVTQRCAVTYKTHINVYVLGDLS